MEQQVDVFDLLYPTFKFPKDKPLRVVELFAGIGFQRMGMELAEIPHEVVATSEVDKFAIDAYCAIHGENPNLGDITQIKGKDLPQNIDILTYSFPCTDLSKAGQQKGMGCGTQSGLVWEVMRILRELKAIDNLPKVLIMENVVDLIQAKFVKEFGVLRQDIEKLGYSNYVDTLNARHYGIAQNRDRVFMVSILGNYNYNFPIPFPLKYKLKDYLEHNVDEKYFLSDKMYRYLNTDHPKHKRKDKFIKNQKPTDYEGWANTITTRETNVVDSTFIVDNNHIRIPEDTKKGYREAYAGDGVYINRPHQKRGVVQKGMIQTLKTSSADVGVVVGDKKPYIRKLTPLETGRLMGMNDNQIKKQRRVMSNAQTYKQHGNGIVAQVIALIIGMLYYEDEMELRETVLKNSFSWIKKGNGNMDMNELVIAVEQWFIDRGLDKADPTKQMLKLFEEASEIASGMARSDEEEIKDGIGDTLVVLIGLSMQMGFSITECLNIAYNEIKDRKGQLINGVFVKEEDLNV